MTRPTLGYYDLGATPFFASRADPRVSYCLFVPRDRAPRRGMPVAVAVHGTGRGAESYRNALAGWAGRAGCLVVAPLFPAGLEGPYEIESYKLIDERFRSDTILLSILDEVAERWGAVTDQVLLHGFSGGGHFAHRFLYLHPDRLLAVSIGAPGMVTRLDSASPWWLGTADIEERFGVRLDLDEIRRVHVQMVIGANDTETWEITLSPDNPHWLPDCNAAGPTRLARMESLKASFERHGIAVRHDVVPAVAHEGMKLIDTVTAFFDDVLRKPRRQGRLQVTNPSAPPRGTRR